MADITSHTLTLDLTSYQRLPSLLVLTQFRQLTQGKNKSGGPPLLGNQTVTTPEIIDKIHDMVMDDRRVKVREIASAVGISNERVHNILHQHLDMTNGSIRKMGAAIAHA
uniref:Uncharacterized protein n=1 Tax=Rhodnius prolixus TaxID=13249 RepID=T1HY16_RHOPR